MDPAAWQYPYNRLASGASTNDLHHHFAQPANNGSSLTGHASSVGGVPSSAASQLLLQAAHSTPLGTSSATFANPASFLSGPSYENVFPLFHTNPKPAHFNIAAQHRQQVLAAQAAATKQTSDSESIIRDNYAQHHTSLSTPQSGSYFDQTSGSVAAALGWQGRSQSDFTSLRSQSELTTNTQLPNTFGILPHENVATTPTASTTTKHTTSSSSYYQTPSSTSTYQPLQSSYANSKAINQADQLQQQQQQPPQQQHSSNYSGSNSQAISSGSKSGFTSTGISSSSQIISSSVPSSVKDYSNSSQQLTSRIKHERSQSPAQALVTAYTSSSSSALHMPTAKTISPNPPSQAKTHLKSLTDTIDAHTIPKPFYRHPELQPFLPLTDTSAGYFPNIRGMQPSTNMAKKPNEMETGSSSNSSSTSKTCKFDIDHIEPTRTANFSHRSKTIHEAPIAHNNRTNTGANNSAINIPDCSNIVIPRRSSPQQINSQPSPCAVPSPHYPMYNSPINSVTSPQQQTEASAYAKCSISPIDATIARATSTKHPSQVAYSSVIQRTALSNTSWDSHAAMQPQQQQQQQQPQQQQLQQQHSHQQLHHQSQPSKQSNPSVVDQSNVAAQKIINSVQQLQSQANIHHTLNQQRQRPYTLPEIDALQSNDNPKSTVKAKGERKKTVKTDEQRISGAPTNQPSAVYHSAFNAINQLSEVSTIGSDRWPIDQSVPHNSKIGLHPIVGRSKSPTSNYQTNAINIHTTDIANNSASNSGLSTPLMLSQFPYHSHPLSHSLLSQYHSIAQGRIDHSNDQASLGCVGLSVGGHAFDAIGTVDGASAQMPPIEREDEPCQKVICPNIEDELGFLAESTSRPTPNVPQHVQQPVQSASGATQNNLTLLGSPNTNNVLTTSHHPATNPTANQYGGSTTATQHTAPTIHSNVAVAPRKPQPLTEKKFATPTGPGSGFMASYLKFLQGERVSSPPPMNSRSGGGNRRSWSKTSPANVNSNNNHSNNPPNATNASPSSSSGMLSPSAGSGSGAGGSGAGTGAGATTMSNTKNAMSNGAMNMQHLQQQQQQQQQSPLDSKSDYYHYDRKRSATDDDDTLGSSNSKQSTSNKNSRNKTQAQQQHLQHIEQQLEQHIGYQSQQQQQQQQLLKAPQVPIAKKARANSNVPIAHQYQNDMNSIQNTTHQNQTLLQHPSQAMHQQYMGYQQDEDVPQRRETTQRKAKNRGTIEHQMYGCMVSQTDDMDEPAAFAESDSDWAPSKDDIDDEQDTRRKTSKRLRSNSSRSNRRPIDKQSLNTEQYASGCSSSTYQLPDQQLASDTFSDDFIIDKKEVFSEWPLLWRVDGKTLLQRFEPQHSGSRTTYRSISTFATWNPSSISGYVRAKCKFIGQYENVIHVELLRDELCRDTSDLYVEKVMNDALVHQEHFEVFIQTMISKALDTNFLMKIMQEQDDYFLSNVKTIDDLNLERKLHIRNMTTFPSRMLSSMEAWPCYSIQTELGVPNNGQIICAGCSQRAVVSRFVLCGQPYNMNTLDPIQLDNRITFEKNFLVCQNCKTRCELYHKMAHQKWLMSFECSRKVAEKNSENPMNTSTAILNELLADEEWLAQMFKNIRYSWAEIDQMYRLYKCSKNASHS